MEQQYYDEEFKKLLIDEADISKGLEEIYAANTSKIEHKQKIIDSILQITIDRYRELDESCREGYVASIKESCEDNQGSVFVAEAHRVFLEMIKRGEI